MSFIPNVSPTSPAKNPAKGELLQDEIDFLCATAYNALLMHQPQKAFWVYRFLSQAQPSESRWELGQAYCLLALGAPQKAKKLLKNKASRLHLWAEQEANHERTV